MWRFWTKGWGPRGWWAWVKESVPMWAAYALPRSVALWGFVRVYASTMDSPGPEYEKAYNSFASGNGR